ncbi:HpcH/HpaI aldolase/citrate lyase family protein [Paracoccus pantotrophus]|uniref:HpcH/HpaI aldolase/citrate lyase family protein n=1 Tax=Paracoccus pantotrophus TaxID=82367 RepID=UPI0004B2C55F|nr:aldolase/citrate lyase family protein [Paracoccus pantotrophus]
MNARETFSRMRHILEIPLADDRYWPRIPLLAADAVMLDLEDSVPGPEKPAARARCLDLFANPALLAGKEVFIRTNGMTTPWAEEDLAMLAPAPARAMVCLPKVETPEEVLAAARILERDSPARRFYVMIESYRGFQALDDILSLPQVVGVHFGYMDYGFEARCRIFAQSGEDFHGPAMTGPRARIGAAAASRGIFATGGSLIPDFRDLARVETFVRHWRDDGYTACIALSPSHLEAVARGIRPPEDDLSAAAAIVDGAREASFIERRLAQLTLHRANCT